MVGVRLPDSARLYGVIFIRVQIEVLHLSLDLLGRWRGELLDLVILWGLARFVIVASSAVEDVGFCGHVQILMDVEVDDGTGH